MKKRYELTVEGHKDDFPTIDEMKDEFEVGLAYDNLAVVDLKLLEETPTDMDKDD